MEISEHGLVPPGSSVKLPPGTRVAGVLEWGRIAEYVSSLADGEGFNLTLPEGGLLRTGFDIEPDWNKCIIYKRWDRYEGYTAVVEADRVEDLSHKKERREYFLKASRHMELWQERERCRLYLVKEYKPSPDILKDTECIAAGGLLIWGKLRYCRYAKWTYVEGDIRIGRNLIQHNELIVEAKQPRRNYVSENRGRTKSRARHTIY